MRHQSLLIRLIAVFWVMISTPCWGSEVTKLVPQMGDSSTMFSFGDPTSFQNGSNEQKQILQDIAKSEFSVDHLGEYERDLVSEALDRSGIEVQDACRVDMNVTGRLGAFFVRYRHQENTRFDPVLGVFETPSEKDRDSASTDWKKINGDYTEYPYPFGDARLIPKVIPVNLSSIRAVDRDETRVKYMAKPSALFFAKMRPEDRILDSEQLSVEFDVDRTTRRVSVLTLFLPEAVRVYRGIKITNLRFEYEFEDDPNAERNVLKRVNHAMKGRIGGIFRPNFALTTELSYMDCSGTTEEHSYLYAAINSVSTLK